MTVLVRGYLGDRTGGEHKKGRRDGRSPASRGTRSNSKDHYACESWPRSLCSIAILPVRCKENPLRRGPSVEKTKVQFLCTHNSARSQMAEGLLRYLAGNRFEAMSAGTEATHIRQQAVRAMDELGIDISAQESKTLDRYLG